MLMSAMQSYLSSKLLDQLQKAEKDTIWDQHSDMLLWLLYIGGTFASPGSVRSRYIDLLRANMIARFSMIYSTPSRILEILRQFIWSDVAFSPDASRLWEEILDK